MCSAVWSNEIVDDMKVTIYHHALSEFTYELIEQTALKLTQECRFFPKPVEFRERIARAAVDRMSPGDAWRVVQSQINDHGFQGYANVQFDFEPVRRAVESLGWRRICLDETTYIRRDFDKAFDSAYEGYLNDVQTGSVPLPKSQEQILIALGGTPGASLGALDAERS